MTSLRASLPRAGSVLWPKDRQSSSTDSFQSCPVITHVVIREVWQKAIPSPHALYKIDVMTKSNHWSVMRRYREFSELHKTLVNLYGIPKDMLPPKKLTANLKLHHLESRREALEHYLQKLVNSSTYVSSSKEILAFLDVSSHDVMSVTQALAKEVSMVEDAILVEKEQFSMTPTQLYCITKQLQLPEPIQATEETSAVELGNLYSFIYQLESLEVNGKAEKESKSFHELANHLEFDISLFKVLKSLVLNGCPVKLINGLSELQTHLKYLTAYHSLKTMKELLVDRVYTRRKAPRVQGSVAAWRTQMTARLTQNRVVVQPWTHLTNLNLSHNKIVVIDESLRLLPALESLDLSFNEFESLDLQEVDCPSLTQLDLSHNSIQFVSATPRDLRHLKSLILNHNNLQSLSGLDCLVGLIELGIAENRVSTLTEFSKLTCMSQLRYLSVNGNPLTRENYYRVKIFHYFNGKDIVLDNKPKTLRERARLNQHFKRSRASTSPVYPVGSAMVNRQARAQSYGQHHNIDGDDDNDSGIEGSVACASRKGSNPFVVIPDETPNLGTEPDEERELTEPSASCEEIGLVFNWKHFTNPADPQSQFQSSCKGTSLEVRGREEIVQGDAILDEEAIEACVNGVSSRNSRGSDDDIEHDSNDNGVHDCTDADPTCDAALSHNPGCDGDDSVDDGSNFSSGDKDDVPCSADDFDQNHNDDIVNDRNNTCVGDQNIVQDSSDRNEQYNYEQSNNDDPSNSRTSTHDDKDTAPNSVASSGYDHQYNNK